jgi:hypothetical protein
MCINEYVYKYIFLCRLLVLLVSALLLTSVQHSPMTVLMGCAAFTGGAAYIQAVHVSPWSISTILYHILYTVCI